MAYDVIDNAITRNLEYSFNEESEESDEDDEDEDNEDTSEVDDETDFISDESLHVLQLFTLMTPTICMFCPTMTLDASSF